jgi:hypothetical protein
MAEKFSYGQRNLLTSALRDAQQKGELPGSLDAEAISREMLALLQKLIPQQAWEPQMNIESFARTAAALIGATLSFKNDKRRTPKSKPSILMVRTPRLS